jgi:hypothetical protein
VLLNTFPGLAGPIGNSYVAKAGDTMGGVLKLVDGTASAPGLSFGSEAGIGMYRGGAGQVGISSTNLVFSAPLSANVTLAKAAGGNTFFGGSVGSLKRWLFNMGDSVAETGSNSGSNFSLSRFNDAGTAIDSPISIPRSTGAVELTRALRTPGIAGKVGADGAFGPESFIFNWESTPGRMRMYATNYSPGYVTTDTSDERVKTRVRALDADEDAFMEIEPISYGWANSGVFKDDGQEHWGFSAQNIAQVIPSAVVGSLTAMHEDGVTPLPASLDDRAILAQTVLMVQGLLQRVADLEALAAGASDA